MISIFRRLRVLDYLIFASVITVSLWAFFFLYTGENRAQRLVIETPSGKWIYPLTETRTVVVPGAIGNTTVRIENNTAFISDSPCPNKTCVNAAALKKTGDWNACLPNRVFLHIEGGASDDIILLQN
jgi:hypothetical protein